MSLHDWLLVQVQQDVMYRQGSIATSGSKGSPQANEVGRCELRVWKSTYLAKHHSRVGDMPQSQESNRPSYRVEQRHLQQQRRQRGWRRPLRSRHRRSCALPLLCTIRNVFSIDSIQSVLESIRSGVLPSCSIPSGTFRSYRRGLSKHVPQPQHPAQSPPP